jgi:hypothetical protein
MYNKDETRLFPAPKLTNLYDTPSMSTLERSLHLDQMYNKAMKAEGEDVVGLVLTSQKVVIKSFRKSQFPHKFVNLFFI